MFELLAESFEGTPRWQGEIIEGKTYSLGRESGNDFPTPFDSQISRKHADLRIVDGRLQVIRKSNAHNPIYFQGEAADEFDIGHNQTFVIGQTCFRLRIAEKSASSSRDAPLQEVTFGPQALRKIRFRDADKRIDVLTHLPQVILDARNDDEMFSRLLAMLLTGLTYADAVAVVRLQEHKHVELIEWNRIHETKGRFQPSKRLISDALQRDEGTVLHVWDTDFSDASNYTEVAEFDWAFCTPVGSTDERPWGLYVTGRTQAFDVARATIASRFDLQADVKFTELVSEIIRAVRRLNQLERQQAGLRQFFAPPILSALGDNLNTDLLEPRECDVTVMFCDLRGFSQQAEEAADNLTELLRRVSRALEVMTQNILAFGGVTGDFQGDAALGFWGWPFASNEAPVDACRAALSIRKAFEDAARDPESDLADFRMGIGIAHGRAVAGKIGTSDQVKVTVFGPVVNLASRLEGLTKQLRVPILLDEATGAIVANRMKPSEGRIRKLAKIQPYGMETPVLVSELLPSVEQYPEFTDEHLQAYERGVDSFIAGDWNEAYSQLHLVPASDRAQDFLALQIAQHNRVSPPDWDGVIRMQSK